MTEIDSIIKIILKEIRANENGPAVDAMNRMGLIYNKNFGVSLARLKYIADKYKPNHDLAKRLREKNFRETLILADMVENPEMVSEDFVEKIAQNLFTNELAEQACLNLFEKLQFIDKKAAEWIFSDKEFVIVSGFIIFSRLALSKKDISEHISKIIRQAEKLAAHKSLFVRKAIARALRQIALINNDYKIDVLKTVDAIKQMQTPESDLIAEEVIPLIN